MVTEKEALKERVKRMAAIIAAARELKAEGEEAEEVTREVETE